MSDQEEKKADEVEVSGLEKALRKLECDPRPESRSFRRRLQDILLSAGVDRGRVAVEVLFWLPEEFVREYQDLFSRSLHLGDGDDSGKAGADEGRLVKKLKAADRGTKRGLAAHGSGGGKRYKNSWVVKDEEALELKNMVDKKLRGLISREKGRGETRRSRGGGNPMEESHGSTPVSGGLEPVWGREGQAVRKRCRDCGKLCSLDWVRCPFPHA